MRIRFGMGLWLCIPAILFFADPNIGFRDRLPDCIGYLLLCAGLSRAADLNDYVADAVAAFKKMVWVSVGAMLAEYYLYTILPGDEKVLNTYENPTLLLLCSFVMLVIRWYLVLPACRDLFVGLGAFAERHGGDKIRVVHGQKTPSERVGRATRSFVIWSSVISLLPELAVLGTFEYEVEKTHVDWYRFVELFRTVATLVLVVLAVVWLVRSLRYAVSFLSDRSLCRALNERYESESRMGIAVREWKRYRFAFWFLMLGAVFSIGLRMDNSEVLPNTFCALFCAIGVLLTGVSVRRFHRVWILAGAILSALISTVAQRVNDEYFQFYFSAEASYYSSSAYRAFLELRLLQIVEVMLVLMLWGAILVWLYAFIKAKSHILYRAEDDGLSARATARLHRKFYFRILLCTALFSLSAIGQAVEIFFRLQYPWLWWICAPVSVAAVIAFVSLLFSFSDHLYEQAQSDLQMHKA